MEATFTLLAEEGPDAYSAAAVAKHAGVSKATLFHHFPRFDELPLEAAEALFSQSVEMSAPRERSLEAALHEVGARSLRLMRRHAAFLRAYMVFFVKGLFDARYGERMVQGLDAVKTEMEQELTARLPDDIPSRERRALTHLLAASLDGLGLHDLLRPDDEAFRESWALLADAMAARYAREERSSQ